MEYFDVIIQKKQYHANSEHPTHKNKSEYCILTRQVGPMKLQPQSV